MSNYIQEIARVAGTYSKDYKPTEAENSERLTRSATTYPKTTVTQLKELFQPIETASKEARLILIDKDGYASVGYWHDSYQTWTDAYDEHLAQQEFLYWLPGEKLL